MNVQPTALAKPQLSKAFRPNWVETLFQYENFYSTGNYNTSGKLENLPSSNSFWASTGFDFAGRYTFSHRLAATMGLNYINAQANQASLTRYNGGIQTLKGSLEYKMPSSYADFILEGVAHISIYKPNESTALPVYGDGAHAFGGNYWIMQKIDAFYWSGKIGLLIRSDGLSTLAPYQAGLYWRIGSWTLGGVFDGSWSVIKDSVGYTKRINYLKRSNAGSMIYRSANSSSSFLDLQFKSDLTHQFAINGGIGTSLFGNSAGAGFRYFIGIDIFWEPVISSKNSPPLRNAVPPKSSYDENLDNEVSDSTPLSI